MLQIRVTDGNGTNPVILEGADNRQYAKALSTADEGVSFDIPKNDPKVEVVNPYNVDSYTRLWEVWETRTNTRLNYGPITSISDNGENWKVAGAARSSFLADHFQTVKTFYSRIDTVVDEIRYENIASAPSTVAYVSTLNEDNADENTILFGVPDDIKYYNLSKRSKDFVIDDETGYIPLGKIEPPRTFTTTSQYWTGVGPTDSLMLDFGDSYPISKLRYLFPWWGGPQRASNRTYEFTLSSAIEGGDYIDVAGQNLSLPTEIFDTATAFGGDPNRIVTTPNNPMEFYIGTTVSGEGTRLNTFNVLSTHVGPLDMRYLITNVNDTHAWYGSNFDNEASYDGWDYQCDTDYTIGDNSHFPGKRGLMQDKEFPATEIKPSNDCHASIVEIGAYKEIVEKGTIKPLALQRIDNNNRQITYYRVPDSTEMKKYTVDGKQYRKFEPGTFFRNLTMSWSGASTNFTKFYFKDCSNCYPDGWHFGVVDDENHLFYSSDSTSGTNVAMKARQYTKHLITRGSSTSVVTSIDAWKGKTDPLSWGGSYSFTEKTDDFFRVDFRGESFKWFGTVPTGKTGATVKIELRHKTTGVHRRGPAGQFVNVFSGWVTLESAWKIPDNITNEVIYEIPYGSSLLLPEVSYEIKITLLDDNYASVDCIEGYWGASFTEYNEDSSKINLTQPDVFKQIYNKRFTGGSMYKWNKPGAGASFYFEGDRIIIQSAKGRNHGQLTLLMFQYESGVVEYDPGVDNHIFIPGGEGDGSLIVNLDTGKRGQEIPNFIIFDSNDYFGDYGLPWGKYTMSITYRPAAKYTTTKSEVGSDSFQYRCRDCHPVVGEQSVEIYKYVYLDAIGAHERIGLSVNFDNQSHLDILQSIADAIQVEWDIDGNGLTFEPRIGSDTDIALREGENTVVSYSIENDMTKIATRLLSYGTAIDGLDLFTVTEDKKSRRQFGRTITRQNDFRDVASYNQLIGLSRTELKRRSRPEKRVTVTHTASQLDLQHGDSFVLWTRKSGNIRLRIQHLQIGETSSGRVYTLECVEWPQIV